MSATSYCKQVGSVITSELLQRMFYGCTPSAPEYDPEFVVVDRLGNKPMLWNRLQWVCRFDRLSDFYRPDSLHRRSLRQLRRVNRGECSRAHKEAVLPSAP